MLQRNINTIKAFKYVNAEADLQQNTFGTKSNKLLQ